MFGRSMRLPSKVVKDVMLEKFSEESEEDFRQRRFIKLGTMCSTTTYLLDSFVW